MPSSYPKTIKTVYVFIECWSINNDYLKGSSVNTRKDDMVKYSIIKQDHRTNSMPGQL